MSKAKRSKALPKDYTDPRHRSSKNTHDWCKGRVGVEHEPVWTAVGYPREILPSRETCSCKICGKSIGFDRRQKVYPFGEILAALRKNAGVEQADVAESVGVPVALLAEIESGAQSVSLKKMPQYLRAVGAAISVRIYPNAKRCWGDEISLKIDGAGEGGDQ